MTNRMDTQGTAFVICCYRAMDMALSGDCYAHMWVTPQARQWAAGFLEVSACEAQAHCLRNRFFLDAVTRFMDDHKDGVFVNIGAGYSLYAHLLPKKRSCDVDHARVVGPKARQVALWEASGQLPQRDVFYLASDLENSADLLELEDSLRKWINGAPTFFLIEGVLFFLQEGSVDPLFEMFARLQKPGDQLGAVSFIPETFATPVYQRLLRFLAEHLGEKRTDYLALPVRYYEELAGYRLLTWQDECALSRKYCPETAFNDPLAFLNEHVYMLEKCTEEG